MLSGNCTEALSVQANVTISGSSAKLIKNGIAPLPFPTGIELSELRQDRSADFSPLPAVWAGPERGGLKSALLNSMAVLPFPLPALLKQYWYIKRGEGQGGVRVRGHPPFYATLGLTLSPREERVGRERERGTSTLSSSSPRPS